MIALHNRYALGGITHRELADEYGVSQITVQRALNHQTWKHIQVQCAPVNSDLVRFWAKVSKTENCWEWTGALQRNGYGWFRYNGKMGKAHRYSHLISKGDPGKLCVLHRCDNKRCVRPDHLFLGTVADNNADCIKKGRAVKGAAKLNEQIVACIRERFAKGGITWQDLANEYGVHVTTIQNAISRRSWK